MERDVTEPFLWQRREVMAAAGALALAGCARTAGGAGAASEDERLHALLSAHFEERLRRDPEQATSLGIDTGARAELRSRMSDWSPAARAAQREAALRELAELRSIDRSRLGEDAKISYDIALFELERRDRFNRLFPYHTAGFGHRAGPYGVTQLGGFYTALPRFFDNEHPLASRADAEAYLARMRAVPGMLDADTEIVRANAAMGVIAPRFILEQAIRQVTALRQGPARDKTMVRSLARRTAALGLSGYEEQALSLWDGPIRTALTRQIDMLSSLLPRAGQEAGVGRLPNGPAYYAETLKFHTTTDLGAAEIHRMGLAQVADLNGRIDALLKAQGFTQGSLRQRLSALASAPDQQFPNSDPGRAQLLAYLNERLAAIAPLLPSVFSRIPRARYEIHRVPPEVEAGAPGGSAQRGSLDGSRPGIFYINLRDTHEWPRYTLPTLAFHEGAPGHLFEGALGLENGELPLYRQLVSAAAYSEGWGLYAEQVADELGMYGKDPLGRIGYLASYLFRATRLVVDTGLHSLGWSREQAVEYMAENSSEAPGAARTEIDRYIVYPGQACSYKIGQTVIASLRREAEARPGFDIKRFHDLVLGGGRMPLSLLERRVRAGLGA